MPVYRLGKNVVLNPAITVKLEDLDLSRQDAKVFVHDLHRTIQLKRILATEELTPERRAQLQAEYNNLLNKYFIVQKSVTPSAAPPATRQP